MKTAGILAGHIRTWNQIKYHAMNAYKDIFGDIDWYVAVWGSKTETREGFSDFFNENSYNLISLDYLDVRSTFMFNGKLQNDNATMSRFYLISIAARAKRKYELKNNILYDKVIFTRPDVLLYYDKSHLSKLNNDKPFVFAFTVSGDFVIPDLNFPVNTTADVFFICGSCAADLLGHFYWHHNSAFNKIKPIVYFKEESHAMTRSFFDKHNLIPDPHSQVGGNKIITSRVIRPTTDFNKLFREYTSLNLDPKNPHRDVLWDRRLKSVKKFYLNKFNIDEKDYGKW